MVLLATLLLMPQRLAMAPQSILILQRESDQNDLYTLRIYIPKTKRLGLVERHLETNSLEMIHWAPDARHFAYRLTDKVTVVSVDGGPALNIDPGSGKRISWLDSETLAFSLSEGTEIRYSINTGKRSLVASARAVRDDDTRGRFRIDVGRTAKEQGFGVRDLKRGKFFELADSSEGAGASWAPNADKVLVCDETRGRLYLYDPATRKSTTLDAAGHAQYYAWTAWSPTARYLAYNRPFNPSGALTVVDVQTKAKWRSENEAWCVQWARDEQKIYFAEHLSDPRMGMGLYEIDRALRHPHRVTLLRNVWRIAASP